MTKAYKILTGIVFSLLVMIGIMFPSGTSDKIVQMSEVSANDLAGHLPVTGEVNGNGVYGYTTNYVCYGGAQEVQHKVQDGWHITLKNYYYSHGVEWYECWDTDDGDYYGWIDLKYIHVYGSVVPEEPANPITNSYSITPRSGQVAGNGVYGYTSNYVLYGGSQTTQHKVQNNWHITAYSTAYSHGVTWYECWDTDDGDYYGWIDANYISFYDQRPQTQVVTSVVTVTVPVEVTVTQLVTVTVTEMITETQETETSATETSAAEEMVIAAIDDEDKGDSDNNGNLIILLIAAAVIVLIALSAVLIVLISRKPVVNSRPAATGGTDAYADSYNNAGFCENCGAEKTNPDAMFCSRCGKSFR